MDKIDIIISLTSWKKRIEHPNFPKVIFSLLRQKTKYNFKVVLVLSREELCNDYKLPNEIILMQENPNFEILWTYKDTKALKNYNPTNEKYPDIPIIVLGDDIIFSKNLVEICYNDYLKSDKKTVLCARLKNNNGLLIPHRIRLFPPHCMHNVDEDDFKYFNNHNDLFYAVRLKINNTNVQKMNWEKLFNEKTEFSQDVRLKYTNIFNDKINTEYDTYQMYINEIHPEFKDLIKNEFDK